MRHLRIFIFITITGKDLLKNKISFKKNLSKNNIYILKLDTNIIGHIKSFRLDSPEIKNYNFEIIKFEKDDKNIMDNFEITLKNMTKK